MNWKEDYLTLEESFIVVEEMKKNPPKTHWDLTVKQRMAIEDVDEFLARIEHLTYY
tara:strand:+ start:2046 stop:2213 length:168 start_codon:yes stop_codon:yes gene_type:complete